MALRQSRPRPASQRASQMMRDAIEALEPRVLLSRLFEGYGDWRQFYFAVVTADARHETQHEDGGEEDGRKVGEDEIRESAEESRTTKKSAPPPKELVPTSFFPTQNFSAGGNINISKRSGYQAEGTIAIDPTNPNRMFAASNLASGSGLFAAYSTDAGVTWTTRTMASGADGLPTACCDGSSSWDQFGNLFVGYIHTSPSPAVTVVVRSTDGGQTFSLVQTFAAQDQPTVTTGPGNVAGTGSVWVSWVNSGLVAAGAQVTGLGSVGAFGATQAAPGGTSSNFGDIAIGPNGAVMVTYQDNTGGEGLANIRMNVDPDGVGGAGFGAAVLVTTTNVGGFDFIPAQARRSVDAEAALAWDHTGGAHNGRVYMVYTSESPDESNDMDIQFRFSDNNGTSWSAPVRLNDDATTRSQFFPRIALDQSTGNLAVTWFDARNDAGTGGAGDTNGVANDEVQLWGTVSTTFGASFDPNQQISTGTSRAAAQTNSNDFGDYNGLAFVSGAFYPIWPDNSPGLGGNPDLPNFDMATARVTLGASVPSNDNFASRITLSGTSTSAVGSNVNGTKESGEPNHAGNAGGKSVWWSWTAPTSQSYVITTAGSSFNTLLGVYTGTSVAALTTVVSNDDENNPSVLTSRVVFNAVAGTTYQIAVDGFGGASGSIALAISLAQHAISGSVFIDRNTNGTADGGEPGQASKTVYIDANNNGILDSAGNVLSSTDVPKPIPDVSTVTSTRPVSGISGLVTDVNVTLDITHTFDSDLSVTLISPVGTRIGLFSNVGGSGDNFTNTTLDDEAATAITSGTAPFTGSFRPTGLLSGVDGQNPNGTWTLEVSDTAAQDTGTLNSWSLTITSAEQSTLTDGSGNYSFSGLASGTYNLRQVVSAGFLQTTPAAGGARTVVAQLGVATTGQTFGNFPTTYNGSASNDSYALSLLVGGTTLQILETLGVNPTVTYTIPKTTLGASALTFNGNNGDDAFTVDYANGSPVPTGGISLFGNANVSGDSLTVNGSSGADSFSVGSSTISNGGTINYSSFESLTFNTLAGNDTLTQTAQPGAAMVFNGGTSTTNDTLNINAGSYTLNNDASVGTTALNLNLVNAGTSATFNATQHLNALSLASGSNAVLSNNGSRVLITKSLTVSGTGQLDLRDNDLVVNYTGSTVIGSGSAYTGVTGMLQSGYNGGPWNGPGIASTAIVAGPPKTTLGVAEASDVLSISGSQTELFDGQTVDATAVIVKYTYAGDANLDGTLNGDDYFQIDSHFNQSGLVFGYYNGDFDYNGNIDGDDYFVIDSNYNAGSTAPVI